ncbi:hypothetical protein GQ600_25585 [Phytophthora cactorum]|nr:hypothetical protein GQ600_25585 [Phytophthora cactorum]
MRGELPSRPTICEDNQWDLVKRMCALNPEERIKISTVVDEFDTLANASIGNQTENYIVTSAIGSVESVSRAISEAREMLVRPQGSTDRRDAVLSLYVSLWDSLEEVKVQLTKSLLPNVGLNASVSTLKLQDTNGNRITYAETTMRYFALDRRLDKLCEAYSIVRWKMDLAE